MSLNYLKEKIKDNVTVFEVAERYLGYPKDGNRYHCHITPSESRDNLAVYKDHWHCFYCNQGGDAIQLVQSIFDLDFVSAMNKISHDFGIIDDTKEENLTPAMRKHIFETTKAHIVRECEKRRSEERERKINRQIDYKIAHLNGVIDHTDFLIRYGQLTDTDLDKTLEININAELELKRLLLFSDIMSCKTLEGQELYMHPETTTEEKLARKNALVRKILCQQETI